MPSKYNEQTLDTHLHNATVWDHQALLQQDWSRPVSSEQVAAAKQGLWDIHITKKPLPETWLPKNIRNKDILCLASAGGQQAPILAAAGARVTVFDISEQQLEQDKLVATRDNLALKTVQGDMSDLSIFQDSSFDYIIHPISNLYVSDLRPVWSECYRVLRTQGLLLASFYNPVLFVFARDKALEAKGLLKPQYQLPYADIRELSPQLIEEKMKQHEALIFGHTLSNQINGQIEAGFLIAGFYEDEHPSPRFLIEKFMKTMIATRAVKLT
ncbi:ubiquinone/menaquinone biosynthesis methyltransferase [Legionella massiliensis]|uniref:Ubiquinone/menaquinone biosynthesis methyltransferase n=1 Tax=Legionella massiliensis TaxID=1034943 RepID=A0A078L0J6_9GAMM|nr:class I SAM-dependent methyltransferase [Legionella massiliensis]CDZ77569.1 ubiquinone/menaquinone biosynthesis methyltransferase [Legionella massiliensis]CEE13307.1 Ubiquinone biosynthesis O-methyltransferase [Legionella massiliensis]